MIGVGVSVFAGRTLGVATMHGKQRVIGPALQARLPLAGHAVVPDLDTDRFGAFSGEVRRELLPRDAAEAKARAGGAAGTFDLVIASEGSFGPHPEVPLLPCDEEWLVLVDLVHERVWSHRHVTVEAVGSGRACASLDELRAFVRHRPFPEHRLVLRPRRDWTPGDPLHKGLSDAAELERLARGLLHDHGGLWVEMDLRAHCNPTRMTAIARAAQEFAAELATPCPACGAAHFRVEERLPGLPCAVCRTPTRGVRATRRACAACDHRAEAPRDDGRLSESPAHCDACNP